MHIVKLRAQASSHYSVNALWRLSISRHVEADPGLFQLWCTVQDTRRMLRKHSTLVDAWKHFTQSFDGLMLHGPFSKLLSVLSQIG